MKQTCRSFSTAPVHIKGVAPRSRRLYRSLLALGFAALGSLAMAEAPTLGSRSVPVITVDGQAFRDLDRDGKLSPFEDWRLEPGVRAADLVGRMTLAEKAGLMMHSTLVGIGSFLGNSPDGYDLDAIGPEILDKKINSFITRLPVSPTMMAEQNNAIQEIAEQSRFAVPVTVSTDPRNHFDAVLGAGVSAGGYSRWPDFIGFGALADVDLMTHFADIVRREYRATGIHQALSPQADLFTEPRWSRGTGTFGSDPELAHDLVRAYVAGFQGGEQGLTSEGVLTVVKHWVAYGATPNGWDGHNYYGRFADVDEDSFQYHVRAFEGAFDVGVGGVMPTYSIVRGANVNGQGDETVAAGFSGNLLNGLLREKHGFGGIVLSDWGITRDCTPQCLDPDRPHSPMDIAMPWGVEELTPLQRYALGIKAGIDQFGGVSEPEIIVEAVEKGLVETALIDEAAARVLESKFRLGLFENPYVDAAQAGQQVGLASVQAEADQTQARAQVLLKNHDNLLPLAAGTRVWLDGIDADVAKSAGLVPVSEPADAEVALVRGSTPHELLHPYHFFGSRQHEGRLNLQAGDHAFDVLSGLDGKLPTVLAIYADRPPILTAVEPMSSAILVNFGIGDAALLGVLTGAEKPAGRLPFEFPSSMAAVGAQDPAVPDDSKDPLYPRGAGLSY